MRLDYALYGLAIVLFAVSAVSFFAVSEQDGQILYVVSTAVVGLLSAGTGYVSRPKAQASAAVQPAASEPQAVIAEPVQQTATVEVPVVEAPIVIEVQPAAQVVAPPAVEAAPQAAPAAISATSELTQIRGINSKRAEQLKANGISNIEELAIASAEDLAAKLNVSPKIVKMWIGSAKKLPK